MIKQTNVRTGNGAEPYSMMRPASEAFKCLLLADIAWSAQFHEITNTKVVAVTPVMGCVDTTTYEGSAGEMKLLVEAACSAVANNPLNYKDIPEVAEKVAAKVVEVTGGNPLLISMGGGMIAGRYALHSVAALMLGLDEKSLSLHLDSIRKSKDDDLVAAILLHRQDGASVEEVLNLATAKPTYDKHGKVCGLVAA